MVEMHMTLGWVHVGVFLGPVRGQVPTTLSQAGNGPCIHLDQHPNFTEKGTQGLES